MKLKIFSIVWAVIYLSFGLGLLFIPIQLMAIFGVTLDSDGIMMARILGAALTAYGLTFWLNRNLPATDKAWHNLLLTSFIYNIVVIPIMLIAVLDGVTNAMGWMPFGQHIFLAATFGYFTFRN
ncbi:hypothetical protein [Gramella sp. AN32]|uniref:Uncharacterized protein n=1 Tax=Christiangramia antarctica TaxID=2058158 RepID=A0ABW5X4F3_9FLAO|nr:hypothetical protein [Gramella sp. AN32]MCM4156898.1 hypothetical protein [Gramella sp. AN32]